MSPEVHNVCISILKQCFNVDAWSGITDQCIGMSYGATISIEIVNDLLEIMITKDSAEFFRHHKFKLNDPDLINQITKWRNMSMNF